MMLHKIKQPRAVSKDLEGKFDGLKTLRWGTAFVDTDDDPKLVILTLNRAGGQLGQKLKKTLKGTGFSKVRIQLEDGTVDEDVGEEDAEEAEEGQASDAAPPPPPWNPADMTARLTGLVKQMVDIAKSAPDQLGELKDLATKAQAAIRTGVENAAAGAVDAFAAALEVVNQKLPPADGPSTPAPTQTVMLKSGLAWAATRKRVEDDLGKLRAALTQHYAGREFAGELEQLFQSKTAPILTTLDQQLASKLEEAGGANDAAEQQQLLGEARQIIGRYETFVNGNSLFADLDNNPFVPLQTQKTLAATLAALKKSIG